MFHDEGRLPELVFDHFLEIHHLQTGQGACGQPVFGFGGTQFLEGAGQPAHVVNLFARFGVLEDGLANRQALKRLAQIHRLAGVAQLQGTRHLLRGIANQRFGERHQVGVIPPGGIELHHGELGVVAHADAFVAVAAVDLEHPLKAADDQALEVKLGRNAQKHFLVQRVVVGFEGLGVGAARNRVQHGGFDFEEVVGHHEFADAADRLAARHETLACGFVGDQVHIALAVFDFLIGHAMEFVRQGAQAFGDQADAGGMN